MFKLLKEIFKSLSKNKITTISLSILLFLTTGVFTLLFSVKESFNRQINRYNAVSKLHDSTVDLDVNFSGNAKDNGYKKETPIEYTLDQKAITEILDFQIKSQFILLSDLGVKGEKANYYISAQDFLFQYEVNKNINNIDNKDFNFDLKNKQFQVLKTDSKFFKTYFKNADGTFKEKEISYYLNKDNTAVFLDKRYKISEVINISSNGSEGYLLHNQGEDHIISSINRMGINLNTKEATFDVSKINSWERNGILYLLTEDETAKLIGVHKDNNNNWKLFYKKDYTSELFSWDNIAKWSAPQQVWNYNIVLKPDGLMNGSENTAPVIKKLFLKNDIHKSLPDFFQFSKSNVYKLKDEWVSRVSYQTKFILHNFTLLDIEPEKGNFSKNFSNYLANLKDNDPEEFKKIEKLHYWEKQIVKTISNKEPIVISQNLLKDDLTLLIKGPDGKTTSIKDIENLGNNYNIQNLTSQQLASLSNEEIVDLTYLKLRNAVSTTIKNKIFDYVKNEKEVDSVGRRRFITTTAIDEKKGENKIFQFIDAGINEEYFDPNHKQEVGKLFNEHFHKSNLFIDADPNFNKNEFNPVYSAEIINAIFQGFVPDSKYLNPTIEFIDIPSSQKLTLFPANFSKEKVVILENKEKTVNFAVGNSKNGYTLYEKKQDSWIKVLVDNKEFLTLTELNNFMESKHLGLKVSVGENGWYKTDENFSNTYNVPFIYRAPSSALLKEIETSKTVKTLFDSLKKTIVNSELVRENFIKVDELDKLLTATQDAFFVTEYYDIFTKGKNNQSLMQRMIFESLYLATIQNDDQFLNKIFNNFLENIQNKIRANGTTLDEQKTYLIDNIDKIGQILSNLGINVWSDLLKDNTKEELKTIINNPIEFIDGLKTIILSIDFKSFLTDIHNWYENKWNKQERNDSTHAYYYFSVSDLVIPLVKSIDFDVFKKGATILVKNINFDSLLSTAYNKSEQKYKGILFNKLINSYKESVLKEKITTSLVNIFDKININKDKNNSSENFKNINSGLTKIISILDKDRLLNIVENSLENTYFEDYKFVNESKDPQKVLFVAKTLKTSNLITAFISTFFKDSATTHTLFRAIEEILNLSGKTKKEGALGITYSVPDKDAEKLDLFDLQNLELLSYAKFEELIKLSDKVDNKILIDKEFDNTEISFIKRYLFFGKDIIKDVDEISQRNSIFKETLKLFIFNKFTKANNSFVIKNTNTSSTLADNLYEIFIENTQGNRAFNTAKPKAREIVSNVVYSSEYSSSVNSLIFYDFWIKFVSENSQLSSTELKEVFNFFFREAQNQNSYLYKELMETQLYDSKKNFENRSFFSKGLDIQPIGRGIAQPFDSADTLFKNIPNTADANEWKNKINKLFDSEIYKKKNAITGLDLADWLILNKVSLVSNLAQIATNERYHKDATNYFVNLQKSFDLLNDFASKGDLNREILNNLRKNFATQSAVFTSLGLSDTVSSTYSSVIFPIVAAWFTSNPAGTDNAENNSNLTFVLNNRVTDFSKIINENPYNYRDIIKGRFYNLYSDSLFEYHLENHSVKGLSLDLSYVDYLNKKVFSIDNQDTILFDININKIFLDLINASTIIREENKFLVFKDVRSLVAKVNSSFLNENNKEIYKEKLPSSYIELEKLINSLDEKYIINISGSKFLIVGDEQTIDYLFPVINEENLQVNIKNQALVYVNKWGFDRARESFRGSALKDYLLVKTKPGTNVQEFNEKTNREIATNFGNIVTKKVFSKDELDIINPERSLRISTAFSLIQLISNANFYMVALMSILIIISTVFITKRYISTRNKVLGILRAQGYNSWMIAFSFISFPFITTFIGGTVGYIVGLSLQQVLKNAFSSYWTLPTQSISFEWIPFVLTIILPFFLLSALVILSALWILRKKPIDLMSGIVEINVSKFAMVFLKIFRFANVKTKFVASLSVNSFWKLISLMISTTLTAFISIFSISSNGVFNETVNKTYQKRNYKYKLDLETPTIEAGQYQTFDKNQLENLLYVPLGVASESNVEANNYFKPGRALVNGDSDKNGNPKENDPHILTRASLQLQVESSLSISPWDIVLNSMPDSQRSRTLEISKMAISEIEKTQDIHFVEKVDITGKKYNFEFVGTEANPQNYFKYIENENVSTGGKFWYMVWNVQTQEYDREAITTSQHRDLYRKFLVDAYKKIPSNDFYIAFNGILFNNQTNEKYTYINTSYNEENSLKIYGYNNNSKYVSIQDEKGVNLIELMEKTQVINDVYPISVNYVFLNKNNLKLGDTIELEVKNPIDRYIRILEGNSFRKYKFKIVGIINTFINSELVTTRKIANHLTGLSELDQDGFNGILSNDVTPEQTIGSVGLYANSGYWFGGDLINIETKEQYETAFAQIYSSSNDQPGVLKNNGYSDELIKKLLAFKERTITDVENIDLSYKNITSDKFKSENTTLIKQGVNNFIDLYSKNVYNSLSTNVDAKDIQIGFVNNIANTVSQLTLSIVIIFFLVSVVILIMISNIIITENEKNIAIFSILGYNNKEKIKLFFGIYLPLIIVATIIAIPLVIGFIALFNAFLISSSSIALILTLKWWHALTAIVILFFVYGLTSLIAWINLNKIKAIYLLKGK
ncbi:ABC transporter permease [Mycoplasma sp. 1012]